MDSWYIQVDKRCADTDINFAKWDILGKDNPKYQERSIRTFDTYLENPDYVKSFVEKRYEYFNNRYSTDKSYSTKLFDLKIYDIMK